jgi:hypothetical protein
MARKSFGGTYMLQDFITEEEWRKFEMERDEAIEDACMKIRSGEINDSHFNSFSRRGRSLQKFAEDILTGMFWEKIFQHYVLKRWDRKLEKTGCDSDWKLVVGADKITTVPDFKDSVTGRKIEFQMVDKWGWHKDIGKFVTIKIPKVNKMKEENVALFWLFPHDNKHLVLTYNNCKDKPRFNNPCQEGKPCIYFTEEDIKKMWRDL